MCVRCLRTKGLLRRVLAMSDNTAYLIEVFIILGWIPIVAIGKAISMCINARSCYKCTCNSCIKEDVENEGD